MRQLVLCGIGITALFLMSCNGTNFTGGNDGTTDTTVTTNAVSTTSSTVLTTDLCNGTTTDFGTVQTALLSQLQTLLNNYSASATATVSGTYDNRYNQTCRQIVTAQQIVASATGFTQDFNSVLQYVCNKLYGSSSSTYQSGNQYDQEGQYGEQQRVQHRPPPPQQQGFENGNNQQRPPPMPPGGFGQMPNQSYNNYNYQGY